VRVRISLRWFECCAWWATGSSGSMPLRRRLFLTLPSPFYALAGISTFSSWDRRTRRMKVIVLIHSLAPTTSLAALHFPFSCELALPPFEPSLRCGVCIEQTRASTRTHLDWTACKLSCVFARWRIVSKPRQCLDIPPGPNRTNVLSLLLSSIQDLLIPCFAHECRWHV
jgi:hypothetical protein